MRGQKEYQTPEIEVTRFEVEIPMMYEIQSPWEEGNTATVSHPYESQTTLPDLPLLD